MFVTGDIDDLEFWLSTDATPAKDTATSAASVTEDTPTTTSKSSKKRSKKKGGAKAEPTSEVTPSVSRVMDEPEVGEEVEPSETKEEQEGSRRRKKGEKVRFCNVIIHYISCTLYQYVHL